LARPSETFFGHRPIFGGCLHEKMCLYSAGFATGFPELVCLRPDSAKELRAVLSLVMVEQMSALGQKQT
jgi:hypothetical protein